MVWYGNAGELYIAKSNFAQRLAERDVDVMSEAEKQVQIARLKSMTLSEMPTFKDIRLYVVMGIKNEYFAGLGGREVPAFYDPLEDKIHTTSDWVGVLAHEAMHHYGSLEFRAILGRDLDEGMSMYLAEQVESDYPRKGAQEIGMPLTLSEYSELGYVDAIKSLIKSPRLKSDDVIRSYFSGSKAVLRQILKVKEDAEAGLKKEPEKGP